MIDIKVIGSGSSGNCYLVNMNGTKLLLECGLAFKTIQRALNFKVSDVAGCLITHEHKDHSKAVEDLMKHGIDCYMSKGTAKALQVQGHRLNYLNTYTDEIYQDFDYYFKYFNRFCVKPFKAVHDVKEPVNFYIQDIHTKESLIFITDTAYIKYRIPDADVLMVECNHIKKLMDERVKNGTLNVSLRNRILKNHLSLENLLEAIKEANFTKLKKVYLLHLSDGNSDEKEILEAVQRTTGVVVEVC